MRSANGSEVALTSYLGLVNPSRVRHQTLAYLGSYHGDRGGLTLERGRERLKGLLDT